MGNITKPVSCNNLRRFGIELELNAFDLRNRPLGYEFGNLPEGIHYIANLVQKTVKDKVFIQKWQNNHNNDCWILKPDSSCGIEICTPVLKGRKGIKKVCSVVNSFSKDAKIIADSRCSFHVHVDVNDLSKDEIATILTWWVKCEYVFMDLVPSKRKRNKYCQMLSFSSIFEDCGNNMLTTPYLISRLGEHKYYTLNTYHMANKKRNTIEFRIMDESCCLNYFDAKNYILLLLHFVRRSLESGMPKPYKLSDSSSGYCWLNFDEFIKFLQFEDDDKLSNGMKEVKLWLYIRVQQNILKDTLGIFDISCKSSMVNNLHQYQIKKDSLLNCDFFQDNFSL